MESISYDGGNKSLLELMFDADEDSDCPEQDKAAVWGGAFIGATMVTACALGSLCLIPCRNSIFYVKFSNFLVALAISTASGAAFFQLAPSALDIGDKEMTEPPVIVSASVMCLVFWYCLTVDKVKGFLKLKCDEKKRKKTGRHSMASLTDRPNSEIHEDSDESCMGNGLCSGLGQVRTVAWVIVVGDGFCNIVDGLTAAASFSVSKSKGITVMIAVVLQELPHRIGDYAVLVNAGMTPFQATFFNLLSTSMAYVGCLLGLVLLDGGYIKESYIFGIGTGIFLYVAVGALTPELKEAEEISVEKGLSRKEVFLLQNAGIFVGFLIVFSFSKFAEDMFPSDGC